MPPVESVAERRRHEPVDVEQRHDAHRHVVGSEIVAARDVAGRNRQIGMRERHALRPTRAAAGVQHQRDVVRVRAATRSSRRVDSDETDGAVRVHVDRQDRHAVAGRAARFVEAVGRQHQHARVGVFEKEAELVLLVAGIERRRGSRHRRREKRHHHRQTVRQRDADAIAASDSGAAERLGQGLDLIAECAVRMRRFDSGMMMAVRSAGIGWMRSNRVFMNGVCYLHGFTSHKLRFSVPGARRRSTSRVLSATVAPWGPTVAARMCFEGSHSPSYAC